MPNTSHILAPQKRGQAEPFYVPESSRFHAPKSQTNLQSTALSPASEYDDTLEPPRGRKRRRSSAASPPPAQQMSTLRGRGRNRSLSSPNEKEEVENESTDDSGDSEENGRGSSNKGETLKLTKRSSAVLEASREVLAEITVYFNTRTPSAELPAVLPEFEAAVTEEAARCYSSGKYPYVEDGSSEVLKKGTAVLDAMRIYLNYHEPTSTLNFCMKKLEDLIQEFVAGELIDATTHRPSSFNPDTFPSNDRTYEGPHVKKRRSQSPSRSRSVGDDNRKSPKPRRRQRTRSRSRSHGLGGGDASKVSIVRSDWDRA